MIGLCVQTVYLMVSALIRGMAPSGGFLMRLEHHQGYILLRNKERPVAVTVDCAWFMSLPKKVKQYYQLNWNVVLIRG